MNKPSGSHTLAWLRCSVAIASTSIFMPYCTDTAQPAAPTIKTNRPMKCQGRRPT
ncbi:hypothetical protein [Xanthomonas nasturtii]|uniref:hypothetical protein n=1 Tax=Xanthomonas nasturtii TaxID=1843581 RepID=UPI0020128EBB|nr:hypothetical protein [Xanthomonas nasturtii]MCL1500193.1 hypothetical protein [Xanthomonas nasturtii]MCL1523764.1 hypothetical protein [Xanthomonas nasturtii]